MRRLILGLLLVAFAARAAPAKRTAAPEGQAKSPQAPSAEARAGEARPDADDEDDDDEDEDRGPLADTETDDSGRTAGDGSLSASLRRRPLGTTTANVGFASDYIHRGVSQTDHEPALQGGLDWTHPLGLYLGAWGSNVKLAGEPASLELDVYGGYTYRITRELSASLGVLRYQYFPRGETNAWDFPAKLQYGPFRMEAAFAPRFAGGDGHAWYLAAGWSDALFLDVTLGLAAGRSFFSPAVGLDDYTDFRVSASRELFGIDWEVAITFVDHPQHEGADDMRLVFSASKSL